MTIQKSHILSKVGTLLELLPANAHTYSLQIKNASISLSQVINTQFRTKNFLFRGWDVYHTLSQCRQHQFVYRSVSCVETPVI